MLAMEGGKGGIPKTAPTFFREVKVIATKMTANTTKGVRLMSVEENQSRVMIGRDQRSTMMKASLIQKEALITRC